MKHFLFISTACIFIAAFASCKKSIDVTIKQDQNVSKVDTIKSIAEFSQTVKKLYFNYQTSPDYVNTLVDSMYVDEKKVNIMVRMLSVSDHISYGYWGVVDVLATSDPMDIKNSTRYFFGEFQCNLYNSVIGYTDIYLYDKYEKKTYVYQKVKIQVSKELADGFGPIPKSMKFF